MWLKKNGPALKLVLCTVQNLNWIISKLEINVMCQKCHRGMAEMSLKQNTNYWVLGVQIDENE